MKAIVNTRICNPNTCARTAQSTRLAAFIGLFIAIFLFQPLSRSLMAQTTTSTIEGTVTDANGAVVAGAEVKVSGTTLAAERTTTTNEEGFYRLAALPAGRYTLTFSGSGFESNRSTVELTVNRVVTFNVQMKVGNVGETVEVSSDTQPLIEPNSSSTGATVTPRQITDFPVNGRNYLDLMQLVPGVAINRQSSGDNANPVLGERSGNNNFFIDGQPNKDNVNGGAAAQFNQETIAEFQVLTSAYKAEFGQASGAIVNVITKTGGNEFHGVGSFFHRNEAFDSVNSLDPAVTDPLHLRRFDYSLALGGPIWKDKVFFFGSSERITEDRAIDFAYPNLGTTSSAATLLALLHAQEDPLNVPQESKGIRNFVKINEQFGRHQLSQEFNYTNEFFRGSGTGLPTSRTSTSARHLLFGVGDTVLLGNQGNPWIVTLRGAYRGEPSDSQPAHPQFTGSTTLIAFPAPNPCPPTCSTSNLFSSLPLVGFGNATSPAQLDQKYTSVSANADKLFGDHDVKFGWQFLRTKVDGRDPQIFTNQLLATIDDYINFGPVNSGIYLLLTAGGVTPAAREIHLKNNYNGLYIQDDWKVRKNLVVNFGVRFEDDSEFKGQENFSPRLGVAWSITPKTVIRSHFGIFYDQFRLGLVEQVPQFGGADRRVIQSLYFPRGFYGSPSAVSMLARLSGLPGPCISNVLTDAQIAAAGTTCPGGGPIVGIDRLNKVVAPGHAFIPANAPINISNVQSLTGLTPDQYLVQAAAAIGQAPGYFEWGAFGVLNNPIIPPQLFPTSTDGAFKTPNTVSFSAGVQREITRDIVVAADYYHREMRDLLGVRTSNLAFRSRVAGIGRRFDPPNTLGEIRTFGPFFEGKYDGLVISANKRFAKHYLFGANYTYAKATDNSLGVFTNPTDNFIGIVPVVVEPCAAGNPGCTQQTNANGSFVSRNGNFVAQAGTFSNGPDLDKGPSSLALDHIFQVNGLVDLPWKFQISGIFRAQSGFHFSRFDGTLDPDGNSNFNGIDFKSGRNAFDSDPFVNLDMRFSKRFDITERVNVQVLFEFFNLLNRQNPAAIQNRDNIVGQPFGSTTQVLPGREGQVGFRIEF